MNSYFLSIDLNLPQKIEVVKLTHKLGHSGLGLYFQILLKLAQQNDYVLSCDYELLAFDLRCDSEAIKQIVEDFGLFEIGNGVFFSPYVCEKMEELEKKKDQKRQAGIASAMARKRAQKKIEQRSNSVPTEDQQEGEQKSTKEKRREENKKESKQKKLYGENVHLTDEEYQKLVAKLGEPKTKLAIEKLDAYKLSSGKKYKSDYGAIGTWVIDAISPPEKGMNGLTKSEMENKFKNAIVI